MMTWNNDPRFWDSLDELINSAWKPLKELLDVMTEYDEDLDLQTKAMLIGGIGTFTRVYAIRRSESNPPELSFQSAFEAVNENQYVRALMKQTTDAIIDSKVEGMKEANA